MVGNESMNTSSATTNQLTIQGLCTLFHIPRRWSKSVGKKRWRTYRKKHLDGWVDMY